MNKIFLVLLHPLSNIKYFNYKPTFNGIFSRNNLPRIKDGANIRNLDDNKSKGTHWVLSFIETNTAVHFDSFGIQYIPQEYKIMIALCVDFIVSLS